MRCRLCGDVIVNDYLFDLCCWCEFESGRLFFDSMAEVEPVPPDWPFFDDEVPPDNTFWYLGRR